MAKPELRKVKSFIMHAGCDLIGAKRSMAASKNIELYEGKAGVEMLSKGSSRIVVIPYANITGYELNWKDCVTESKD